MSVSRNGNGVLAPQTYPSPIGSPIGSPRAATLLTSGEARGDGHSISVGSLDGYQKRERDQNVPWPPSTKSGRRPRSLSIIVPPPIPTPLFQPMSSEMGIPNRRKRTLMLQECLEPGADARQSLRALYTEQDLQPRPPIQILTWGRERHTAQLSEEGGSYSPATRYRAVSMSQPIVQTQSDEEILGQHEPRRRLHRSRPQPWAIQRLKLKWHVSL